MQSRGYFFRYPKTDLGCIFGEKYAKKHFCERKSPNQGTYMGAVIAHPPEQCATTAKTSECQRAGHKRRGSRGQGPRRSFLRLSPEKAGLPPGVGREPTSQVWTCGGPTGTTCRFWPPWDQAPPPPIGPQNSALSTSRCGSRRTAPRCTSPSPQGTPGPPAEGCQTSGR